MGLDSLSMSVALGEALKTSLQKTSRVALRRGERWRAPLDRAASLRPGVAVGGGQGRASMRVTRFRYILGGTTTTSVSCNPNETHKETSHNR